MKKIYLSLLLVFTIASVAVSQNRIALVEQVTSASCGPCASQNPSFNNLLNDNLDKVAVIKYQRGGGSYVDPMWEFNPSQTDSRIGSFYGIFSFPRVWINGTDYGTPSTINQTTLNNEVFESPKFDIEVVHNLNQSQDQLVIEGTVTALQDFQENQDALLRAFIVVIEREVNYSSPPGHNNETDFQWVMRKMLPGTSGKMLGKQLNGQVNEFDYTYDIDLNEIDPSQLEVVVFVQRTNSKDVFQAAKSSNGTLGEEEKSISEGIEVFPTITNEVLKVRLAKPSNSLNFVVYDALGKQVISAGKSDPDPLYSADVSALSNGIYFAHIITDSKELVQKFVVRK